MDRLDELQVLVTILDCGSLAEAARRLRRSAASVTRSLAALEARVGARLVERSTRRLAPTAAGGTLAEDARGLLAGYHDAVRVREEAVAGPLRLTAPRVFGLRHVVPLAMRFMDQYPAVRVELVLNDRNLDLADEAIDVAVRIGPLEKAGLVVRRVGEVRRLIVASPGYLARRGTPATPRDVAGHDTIFNAGRPAPPAWLMRHRGRTRPVRIPGALLVNDVEATLALTRAGRGLANAFSYQVADDLAAGDLVRVLAAFEPAPHPVHLVLGGGRHRPARIRAFVAYAGDELSRLPVIRPEDGMRAIQAGDRPLR